MTKTLTKIPNIIKSISTSALSVGTNVEALNKYQPSINDLLSNSNYGIDRPVIKAMLLKIAMKYLVLNVKGRSIADSDGLELMLDEIIDGCGNLELQEVAFVFKNGILGKYGVIYNDISLDTILGKDGWIESYYKDQRGKRPDPIKKDDDEYIPPPNAMDYRTYINKNPSLKATAKLNDMVVKLKTESRKDKKVSTLHSRIAQLKYFYKLKGLDEDEMNRDIDAMRQYFSKIVDDQKSVDGYIKEWAKDFIIKNNNKKFN